MASPAGAAQPKPPKKGAARGARAKKGYEFYDSDNDDAASVVNVVCTDLNSICYLCSVALAVLSHDSIYA